MSLPALAPAPPHENGLNDGLTRSALLMRALGPNAASVWSHLSPEEAGRISAAMEQLPESAAAERTILND